MAVLQKSVHEASLEHIPSFQETYKLAYSHGLEAIYSLEHVDIKSVRRLVTPSEKKIEKPKTISVESKEIQLEFDLGPFFRNWMVPHIAQEPIQVLQLSKHVEKFLLEKNICTLGNLKEAQSDVFKGLGQGHIEDIKNKLDLYWDKPTENSSTIDFLSLLKCLCADLDRKKIYALLDPHGLADWISLSASETMELKKIKTEVLLEWANEITQKLLQGHKHKFLLLQMQLMIDTWIVPWLWRRGNLATSEQVFEALQLRSSCENHAEKIIPLLFTWAPLKTFLKSNQKVYACTQAQLSSYETLLEMALSYFPHSTYYSLSEFENLLRAELAKDWHKPDDLVSHLRLSNLFAFYKDPQGKLFIKMEALL